MRFVRIIDLPGEDHWAIVVIGEELAHAFLIASQHPRHVSDPPNDSPASRNSRYGTRPGRMR